jgi:hypothetical protein
MTAVAALATVRAAVAAAISAAVRAAVAFRVNPEITGSVSMLPQ